MAGEKSAFALSSGAPRVPAVLGGAGHRLRVIRARMRSSLPTSSSPRFPAYGYQLTIDRHGIAGAEKCRNGWEHSSSRPTPPCSCALAGVRPRPTSATGR